MLLALYEKETGKMNTNGKVVITILVESSIGMLVIDSNCKFNRKVTTEWNGTWHDDDLGESLIFLKVPLLTPRNRYLC